MNTINITYDDQHATADAIIEFVSNLDEKGQLAIKINNLPTDLVSITFLKYIRSKIQPKFMALDVQNVTLIADSDHKKFGVKYIKTPGQLRFSPWSARSVEVLPTTSNPPNYFA